MVSDLKYIIKRIIIGVGIAICLMYLKGGLIGNVSAKVINISAYGNNYTLIKSQNTSSHNVPNLWCQTDSNQFCNNVIAIRVEDDNSLSTDNKYKIENTLQIVVKNNTIPSYRDTTISVGSTNQTPLTFNYNGRNGYEIGSCGSLYTNSVPGTCTKMNWGTQVSFTSTSTGHSIIWYYLNTSYSLGFAEVTSHSVTNTGNTFADSTENIINNQNENTQKIINSQKETKNAIDKNTQEQKKTNDFMEDDSSPDTNSFWNDMQQDYSSTPVSDLLLMPITLLNAYYNGFNSSCSPYSFGSLYGTELKFPCINLESYLGSTLFNIIDSLCVFGIIYAIGMLCVWFWDSLTSLRDTFDSLYVPQHGPDSYQGRHAKE